MSVTSAKSGATGISLALDNNYMEPIATTVTGSVIGITFSNMPQTYKHLQIRGIAAASAGQGRIRFNSDASTNYSIHSLYGTGAAAGANNSADTDAIFFQRNSSLASAANVYGGVIIDILDYTSTNKYKTTRSLAGFDANGSGEIDLESGSWRSFNPIETITIFSSNANFNQYSRFSLYGIKG